jgi:outer membrane protein OmpA-like peptidoglycan-associated protein
MGTCSATIPEDGSDVEARCELVAAPVLVQVEEREIVILEQINFAFDSDEILPSSFGLMDQIARVIREHAQIRLIEIQGHTDDHGTDRYNDSLSQRRAESVRRGLVERGVEQERLTAVGYGERRPIVPNDSDENRAKNRRVQFVIQDRTDG